MDYLSVKEIAKIWGISARTVQRYCSNNQVPGAKKFAGTWAIPSNVAKPSDGRIVKIQKEADDNKTRVGALIVVSDNFDKKGKLSPLKRLGTSSIIKRIVLIFQQANVSPILLVTGYNELELKHHLSDYSVIFVTDEDYQNSDKFSSAKLGINFLKNTCDKIFYTSIKTPMFTPQTLRIMKATEGDVVIPSYNGESGHPILIDLKHRKGLLAYSGKKGMRGAIKKLGVEKTYVNIEDEGVLLNVQEEEEIYDLVEEHNEQLLHPFIRLSIEKNYNFFNSRSKLLLMLIEKVNSVQEACQQMALSKSKAWEMINDMEKELGFKVVDRKQGGSINRKTKLTKKGKKFLEFFCQYEESVIMFARKEFYEGYNKLKKEIGED